VKRLNRRTLKRIEEQRARETLLTPPLDREPTDEERREIIASVRHNGGYVEEFGSLKMGPLFEIVGDDVYCTFDGKRVTHCSQLTYEYFYWLHRTFGFKEAGLEHDEGAQAFYGVDGELAISRDYLNLPALGRAKRAYKARQAMEGMGVASYQSM